MNLQFNRGLLFLFFGATTLGFLSCDNKEKQQAPQRSSSPVLQAEAVVIRTQSLENVYSTNGNLMANEEISLFSEVAGRVTAIYFKEGSAVRKGDLLVQLYDEDIKAQITKLEAQKSLQETTQKRQEELLAISGVSRQEYDNTITQIASIEADIAYNKSQLRKLQIRAPFDGMVGLRNISNGAVVSPNTLISTLQQVRPLKLDFTIPEQYNGAVKVGSEILFTVSGSRDTMKGKIVANQPNADMATRSLMMRALVPNTNGVLMPGVFASVYVPLHREEDAIIIPAQCIIPTTRDKLVAIVKDGKAIMQKVNTGIRTADGIEIIDGLHIGDTVLTTGIMQVKEGMSVNVSKIVEIDNN